MIKPVNMIIVSQVRLTLTVTGDLACKYYHCVPSQADTTVTGDLAFKYNYFVPSQADT